MKDKMVPIPEYGDHMTMKDWIACVNSGGFIDYDGYGNYATATEMHDGKELYDVKPSDVKAGKVDMKWTHIVWFNR